MDLQGSQTITDQYNIVLETHQKASELLISLTLIIMTLWITPKDALGTYLKVNNI